MGVVATETAACRVLVTRVSYDDPGADDAEFIELRVERTGPMFDPGKQFAPDSSAPRAGVADASASTKADTPSSLDAAAADASLTLGDCGLASLELVDGGSGACGIYRTLPLSSVVVPDDGYVTFCATDSTFATARCDVMAAGRSALRNGWLQNGPSDGLRFRAASGSVALELAYEGRIGCFQPNARELVEETGQTSGNAGTTNPADDVNTFCGDAFVLLAFTDTPLRRDAQCPSPPAERDAAAKDPGKGSAGATDRADAATGEADASPWTTERAPVTRPKSSPSIHAALGLDAGLVAIPKPPGGPPPEPPGCSTTRRARSSSGAFLSLASAVSLVAFIRRRRWRLGRRPHATDATSATSGGSDA